MPDQKSPDFAVFTVDTHLFRELGRLLVGRESTALSELIKNAYDADASNVRVYGHKLDDPQNGFIRVTDNGIGISRGEFTNGFLRIASRSRQTLSRRSALFNRRYTGAKGIGRLAAHKLASKLRVQSVPNRRSRPALGIDATIDWNKIEQHTLIDEATDAVVIASPQEKGRGNGTVLTLSGLRRAWGESRRVTFAYEAQALQPPDLLADKLPASLFSRKLLFDKPRIRDVKGTDPGFAIELSGDFDVGESLWSQLGTQSAWAIEIRASRRDGLQTAISPSKATKTKYPEAKIARIRRELVSKTGPFFDARILVRDGAIHDDKLRKFARRNSGIRVYMEGFRVLPYGEAKDDWLDIQASYVVRNAALKTEEPSAEEDKTLGLTLLQQANYSGAVFLTEENSKGLEMLVNREGFVEGEALDTLVESIQWAIRVFIRTRGAATFKARLKRRKNRGKKVEGSSSEPAKARSYFASEESASELADDALGAVQRAQATVNARGASAAPKALSTLESELEKILSTFRAAFGEDLWLLRLLASVGTQMAAFVHEIRGLLGVVLTIETDLRRLNAMSEGPSLKIVRDLQRSAGDLRSSLDRQVSYLVDVVSADARRRRSRQSPYDALEKARVLLGPHAETQLITVSNRIPRACRTLPMFPAELRSVMTNILSNAIKAAGLNGRVLATARVSNGKVTIMLQNTGKAVSLRNAEKWFLPYESSSTDVDGRIGQGMGLGLPITRATLEAYNGTIEFTEPRAGYRTAVRLVIPES